MFFEGTVRNPRDERLVASLLAGKPFEQKNFSFRKQFLFCGKGTGQGYFSSDLGWFLGEDQLFEDEMELLKKYAYDRGLTPKVMSWEEVRAFREKKLREELLEKLRVKIVVTRVDSGSKSRRVVEEEGDFDSAVSSAKSKILNSDSPRRYFSVTVYQTDSPNFSGRERILVPTERFLEGRDVFVFLSKIKKEELAVFIPPEKWQQVIG